MDLADDFGHIVHRIPASVVRPRSADDVAAAIGSAARCGVGFAARGRGHSTFGRSQVADGVVADMSELAEVGDVEDDRIVVGAGATWSEVLAVTLAHGRTPPVLTDYVELSVGGTLVVGGVGARTSAFGVVSDNVIELEVVTGTGETVWCSAGDDLFDAVRAGLGQVGVITRATLRLVAAPTSVRRHLLFYADLAAMLEDARRLSGELDAVQGAILPAPHGFVFRLEAATFLGDGVVPDDEALLSGLSDDPDRREPSTIGYAEYVARLAPLEACLRANGQWWLPHPWLMTFVGDSQVAAVVRAELGLLEPAADLGPLGQVALSPIRRSAISSPLLRMPADELCWAFNLVRIPATADAARLVAANTAVYERIEAAGGTLYPVSALPMAPLEWREHFGAAFGRLDAAKRRFDPDRVLTPGYEVFG